MSFAYFTKYPNINILHIFCICRKCNFGNIFCVFYNINVDIFLAYSEYILYCKTCQFACSEYFAKYTNMDILHYLDIFLICKNSENANFAYFLHILHILLIL